MENKPELNTVELTQKIKESDKKVRVFIKMSTMFILSLITICLAYLVWQNYKSDVEIQKIEKNITTLNEEQLQILTQIKTNQGNNAAAYQVEFNQVKAAIEQQNVYLQCLTTKGETNCQLPQ